MKSAVFLYNTQSGKCKIGHCTDSICTVFRAYGYEIVPQPIDFEANPFDGNEQIDLMVVAGGDGTVNYVVNAMRNKGLDIPLGQMAEATVRMVTDSVNAYVWQDLDAAQRVIEYDDVVDDLFDEVKEVLMHQMDTDPQIHEHVMDLLMIAKYYERIGDHAENVADAARQRKEEGVSISKEAQKELGDMLEMVNKIIRYAVEMFAKSDETHMQEIITLEDQVDEKERELQKKHVERLTKGECSPEAGMIFSDIVSGLERVADHATNIAFAITTEEEMDEGKTN